MQGLLVSALLLGGLSLLSSHIEQYVTQRLALQWKSLFHLRHLFIVPKISIPALHATVESAIEGRATLKQLLTAAGFAAGVPLDSIISRLRQ